PGRSAVRRTPPLRRAHPHGRHGHGSRPRNGAGPPARVRAGDAPIGRHHPVSDQETVHMILRYALALALVLLFGGAPAAKPYDTGPVPPGGGGRWRIGYVESGDYVDYPLTLGEIV